MKRLNQVVKIVISLIILLSSTLFIPSPIKAFSVSDGIKQFNLNPGEIDLGSVEFKNSENKDMEIKVETKSYDPQKEEFVTTTPFVGIHQSKYTVKANQTIEIDYAVSIPQEQPAGSFFNVLTIEPVSRNTTNTSVSVNLKNGFGVLFVFNVTKPDTTIDKIFIDDSDTKLIIENKGLPFISPMQIKYVFENKSDFVFKPQGEIRLVDKDGKQVAKRFSINEGGQSIYPGQKLEIKKNINAWKDLKEVLASKTLVARTYNGYTDNYLTNEVNVSIKEPVIMTAALVVILLIAILSGIISVIRKLSEKKTTKSEE